MKRSKEDAEQTRAAILAAAEHLFFEKGIPATSLDRIARAAGVTRGAVYWHFKDKLDLLLQLRAQYTLPQEELLKAAAQSGHPDPLGLLLDSGNDVLRLFEAEEGRQRLFLILSGRSTTLAEHCGVNQANDAVFGVITRLMEIARDKGDLSTDLTPKEAATTAMIFMTGLLGEWLRSDKAFSLTEVGGKLLRRHILMLRLPDPVTPAAATAPSTP